MRRKQFTFYQSFWESTENLPTNKEKLQAYQLICSFALTKIEPDLSAVKPSAATVFTMARPILETAHKRSEQTQRLNNLSPLL